MKIFINGKFYNEDKAKISVFDRGLLYGDGFYETLRSHNGKVLYLDEHIKRLKQSARLLKVPFVWTEGNIKKNIYKTLKINNLKDAYIRLTFTRGIGLPGKLIKENSSPTFIIFARKLKPLPENCYLDGVNITIAKIRRNHPLCVNPKIKSLNFLNNILARYENKEAFESILLNLEGYVAEGSISNIFIVKNRILKTPSESCGILSGVTRKAVMDLAKKNKIKIRETLLRPKDIYNADECFLTSTSKEILPVRQVDKHKIKVCPGEITSFLLEQYRKIYKT